MSVQDLFEFIDPLVYAAEWMERAQEMKLGRFRSGRAARDALSVWISKAKHPQNTEERVRLMLSGFQATQLTEWARYAGEQAGRKDVAIDVLLRFARLKYMDPTARLEGYEYEPVEARRPLHPFQQECLSELRRCTASRRGKYFIHIATGGGKTRVANDWVFENLESGRKILWVTKDWTLLKQAARDLCRRHVGVSQVVGCVGGDIGLPSVDENPRTQIVYTTIQTWNRRMDAAFTRAPFDIVVIDELHWGEGAPSYSRLLRRYRDRATFVGLTATPRSWTAFERVGRSYDLPYLVEEGFLARPCVLAPVRTQRTWRPVRSGSDGDYNAKSLSELAEDEVRNRLIVDSWSRNRNEYGKTLVFACNIAHAEELARLFQRAGARAEAIHSLQDAPTRALIREHFERNEIEVLVNVAILTTGVDIPDILTLFLARPTASSTLFWQMIGRGTRKTEEKDTFNIVDFVDNVPAHSDLTLTATKELGASFPRRQSSPSQRRRGVRLSRWEYHPSPILRYPGNPGYENLAGLEYQPQQTFGIEFELTRSDFTPGQRPSDWSPVAEDLLRVLRKALGSDLVASQAVESYHGEKDMGEWNVEYDSSCGWEVTTRILRGEAGLEEVVDACSALDEACTRHGLRVGIQTGTHVHLGWRPDVNQLRRAIELAACFEPALLSLVAPSRAGNSYCKPIRELRQRVRRLEDMAAYRSTFSSHEDRYYALNITNLFDGIGTMEVRLHSGTREARKILTWLALWMRLLDAAVRGVRLPIEARFRLDALPLCIGPQGDIAVLAETIGAGTELLEFLIARRAFVVEESWLKSAHGDLAREVASTWG